MDEAMERMLARWAENGRAEANAMRDRMFTDDHWDMDLGKLSKLVRTKTTAELYAAAVQDGPERAASRAMDMVRDLLGGHGSTDQHDQATRQAKAYAAAEVLRTLTAAGITPEQIGDLFLGNRH